LALAISFPIVRPALVCKNVWSSNLCWVIGDARIASRSWSRTVLSPSAFASHREN
jgi:hypothetical protein